jgi:uncharacterized protein (DUF1330 family)
VPNPTAPHSTALDSTALDSTALDSTAPDRTAPAHPDLDARLGRLVGWYGDGLDGAAPTPTQWRRLLEHPAGAPITLINLFRIAATAGYPDGHALASTGSSGQEAFARYSEVSVPAVDRVGARFLLLGPAAGTFIGPEDDWDLIAVGTYPDADAALALYEDADYREAFVHRAAACERQRVLLCAA